MDSKRVKQIVNQIRKSLDNWDYQKAIEHSSDETQTRNFLIHPFFENILQYNAMDDFSHEIIADVGGKRGRRVDIAITLGGKKPLIMVECKSVNTKLNDNHFRQLNEYCHSTASAKMGILTDGIIYKFYAENTKEKNNLYTEPFFTFNLEDYSTSDLEMLALFNRPTIELKEILEEAEEIYFLNQFDDGLYKVLANPSENFLKEIYINMGGKRASEKILDQIRELVNSTSLKTALDRVIQEEVSSSNSGIITTDEEKKVFSVIKTIIAMTSKISNKELARIGYRDQKGAFAIIVDDNRRKQICSLVLKEKSKSITINNKRYDLPDTSVASLTELKKELIDSAISNLS